MEPTSRRLRAVLATNAATSVGTGVVTLLAAHRLSRWFGLDEPAVLRAVGAGLVVFGAEVAWWSRRAPHRLATVALATSVADLAWVAATVVVLAVVDLAAAGVAVGALVGVLVLDFAAAQLWLRSRLALAHPFVTGTDDHTTTNTDNPTRTGAIHV